jgi:hypothetical protein
MSRWSRSAIWIGVAGSAVALATLVSVLVLTDPLGGDAGQTAIAITADGFPGSSPPQAGGGPDTGPGWRVSLQPGSTVDLDTGVVVERADSLAIGADLVFDRSLRLVSSVASEESSRGARLSVLKDPSAWPGACAAPGKLPDYVDARQLRKGSALCALTTAGRLLLLQVDTVPTPSRPTLSMELRRAG